jgi:hypothetical protein
MTAASPHAAAGREFGTEDVGDDMRHTPAFILLRGEIGQPRRQESGGVVEEVRGRGEGLDVAGPTEAFVSLRAVGGNVDEVAAHAPDDVVVELIEQLVGRAEPSSPFQVASDHDCLDVFGAEPAESRHVDIAEAVKRE